jgi:hypothetical protein
MTTFKARRAGRKPKSGARYPSGKLKPSAEALAARRPNPKVLAERRALLGRADAGPDELRRAENPLDCMDARGWLPEGLARWGFVYAELHRRAGLYQPRVTPITESAPQGAGVDKASLSELTPEEAVRVWEAAMSRPAAAGGGEGDPEAAAVLKALWRALGIAACTELHSVCLAGAWPMWAMQKVCGRSDPEIAPKWLRRRETLVRGLELVREHLAPRRVPAPPRQERVERVAGPAIEQTVVYVDEAGAPDPVLNAAGGAVEVVRRRRA